MRRAFSSLIIFAMVLPLNACGNKTTLDKIGAIVVTAVNAYALELDQLSVGGSISPEKYEKLRAQAELAKQRAAAFKLELDAFGAITPGNVSQIVLQFASLTTFLQRIIVDAGLSASGLPFRVLTFAINTLITASAVLAGLYPPSGPSPAGAGSTKPYPSPAQVPVTVSTPDRGVQASLKKASLRK